MYVIAASNNDNNNNNNNNNESSREGDTSGDMCLFEEGYGFHSRDKGLLLSELSEDTDMPEGNGYGAITESLQIKDPG